jgi:nucleotide-binding universal stress UspA family protein
MGMYEKILVPLDGSELAESVLPHVEAIARGCNMVDIVLLRVCDAPSVLADYPESKDTNWDKHVERMTTNAEQQCNIYLGDVEKRLRDKGFTVRTESRLGKPAEEIVDYAAKNKVDLIIMASHGRSGVSRWAYGSVADKVLRSSCVPVLLVKARGVIGM